MVHTAFPIDRQPPENRTTKQDGTSAERQGLEDIGSATNATIDVDFAATRNGLNYFGQRIDACDDAIELATAVVGDNNSRSSIGESKVCIFCGENAFEQDGKRGERAEPGKDFPGEGNFLLAALRHERSGIATSHCGRVSCQNLTEMVANVSLSIAPARSIHREHQSLIASFFRASDQMFCLVEGVNVELKPAR